MTQAPFRSLAPLLLAALLLACASPSPSSTAPAPAKPAATTAASKPAATTPAKAPAATAAAKPAPKEKTNVTLRLGWFARGYDAPYYLARAKGYYDEVGLNVDIKEGQGSAATLNLVAGKQAEFGMVDAAVLMLGADKGVPVTMVAGIMQKSPAALMVHADTGINGPKDLAGHSIGMVPQANTTLLLPLYLDASGVPRNAVNIINTDNANKTTLFREHKYDATSSLLNDEVITLENAGVPVKVLSYADGGVNTLSIGIVAHNDLIKAKPEVVKAFVQASLRGWAEAIKNPDPAIEEVVKVFPDRNPKVTKESFLATVPLLHTKESAGKPLGWMAKADWESSIDLLVKADLMKPVANVETLFTNQFVSGS